MDIVPLLLPCRIAVHLTRNGLVLPLLLHTRNCSPLDVANILSPLDCCIFALLISQVHRGCQRIREASLVVELPRLGEAVTACNISKQKLSVVSSFTSSKRLAFCKHPFPTIETRPTYYILVLILISFTKFVNGQPLRHL